MKLFFSIKGSDIEGWTLNVYKHYESELGGTQDFVYPHWKHPKEYKTFLEVVNEVSNLNEFT